ncbi:tetratricopeptide repeat protein [Pseudohongiella sp. SYSU M77423]|uniref:tetratricopeptide repeat protein n=1 Tax=unclassified Pseudohongiella TaxID=2629611 RepID=UPI001F48AA4F|nr:MULTISPECIES: tetratricopeptide repeat protein [unclassified Pseudohongiella]MDH7943154.1 tetratricopeptide repeat protein [Pseudohongiella sp. SYSU M77423]MEC8860118.1 tetratricopeptide repeat protein [Pseudomonadota bacterium]
MSAVNTILRSAMMAAFLATSASVGTMMLATPAYAQEEDDGPREPPPTRRSDTLSDRVYRVIAEVQELMNPSEEGQEPDLAAAKRELDSLNERYDTLNDFEKATMLNFYTNYYLGVDDIPNALATFERILTIEDLRPEQRLRSLQSLGQLYASEERYEDAIRTLEEWRNLSADENATVYNVLALAHYNLQQFTPAIDYLLSYMDLLRAEGREIARNVYTLLNVMYIELEDYESALDVTKTLVALFDEGADWRNLAAIYGFLDREQQRIQTMELAYVKGYLQSEGEYMNLAQSLAGLDAPIRGIEILEDGIEQGIVEENGDNLRRLTQMYIIASEFQAAVEPAERLVEIVDDGEAWDYLGYIHLMNRDYASAVEAMQTALDRGGLENTGDVQLSLARALVELDRYDEALTAAQRAQQMGANNAGQFVSFVESSKARYEALQEQKERAIEYYQS